MCSEGFLRGISQRDFSGTNVGRKSALAIETESRMYIN